MSGRLLVVSNRLPLTLERTGKGWRDAPSAGGLVTALGPVLRDTRGLWIGWAGDAEAAEGRRERLASWEKDHGFVAVELPRTLAQRFYHGYANGTLWPLFHQFPSRLEFDPADWEAYVEANRRFRDKVLERLRPGDRVWVHDYHLMLLPRLLREAAPDTPIGFFLHTPFPSSDVFRILPRREELLKGLLGADLIAFHTHRFLQHFRSSLLRILGLGSRMDRVVVDGRSVGMEAIPIGIVPDEFVGLLEKDAQVARYAESLRRRFAGRRVLLAVDRLDYTKGLPERLGAYRRLLKRHPQLRGTVSLVQVAVPSRERIGRYRDLRSTVNEMVGAINGDLGTADWTPVVYLRRSVPRSELVALYSISDLAWVTPLCDGMNLVAKEYVACQRGGAGVLLLSEFAGAAAEMGEAFMVNPYDEDETATAVARALSVPEAERRERIEALYRRIVRNDAHGWSCRFLGLLDEAVEARCSAIAGESPPVDVRAVVEAYRQARTRLLLLDYDGTLVPFAARPQDALPPASLIDTLQRLANSAGNRVAILSGRPRADLETWFGNIPGLWLAAEHGAILREPAKREWQTPVPLAADWKERVFPVLEHFVSRTPGSLIEEKEYALVFHHRMSDPEFGEWLANELAANLEEMLADSELRAVKGHKSIEVRLAWANKGEAGLRLLEGAEWELILGLGDDHTDEDLFERLPPSALTIKVGEGGTRARFRLSGPAAVNALLDELAG